MVTSHVSHDCRNKDLLLSRKSSCNTATWVIASLTACCSAICEQRQNSRHDFGTAITVACVGKTPSLQRPFRRNATGPQGTVQLYTKREVFRELSDTVHSASSSVSWFRTIFLRNSFEKAQWYGSFKLVVYQCFKAQ